MGKLALESMRADRNGLTFGHHRSCLLCRGLLLLCRLVGSVRVVVVVATESGLMCVYAAHSFTQRNSKREKGETGEWLWLACRGNLSYFSVDGGHKTGAHHHQIVTFVSCSH